MEKEPRRKVIKGLRTQLDLCRDLEAEGKDMTALIEPTIHALERENILYQCERVVELRDKHERATKP